MTARFNTIDVDGSKMFYRSAGDASAPAVLLLHGFPSASHMFRDLVPELASKYHVIAPDLPGFGTTTSVHRCWRSGAGTTPSSSRPARRPQSSRGRITTFRQGIDTLAITQARI